MNICQRLTLTEGLRISQINNNYPRVSMSLHVRTGLLNREGFDIFPRPLLVISPMFSPNLSPLSGFLLARQQNVPINQKQWESLC